MLKVSESPYSSSIVITGKGGELILAKDEFACTVWGQKLINICKAFMAYNQSVSYWEWTAYAFLNEAIQPML